MHRTWNMLKDICTSCNLPWLCLGDFNEVLHADEHEAVGHQTLYHMQGFRDTVDLQPNRFGIQGPLLDMGEESY
jgi:hypothetical protein